MKKEKFIKWIDVAVLDDILASALEGAGKKPTETLKKKLWLEMLEDLHSLADEIILHG